VSGSVSDSERVMSARYHAKGPRTHSRAFAGPHRPRPCGSSTLGDPKGV